MLFTLVKPGFQTIEWLEVLHIFQNLESNFTQDFTIDHFNDVTYTVTFVFNDGVTANVEKTFFHGDIITPPVPPQSTIGRLRKGSWYANERFSERWNPSERIIGSRTLYLRWLSETCSNATIIGTFRGNVTLYGRINVGEVILQLFSNNTARIKTTSFPNYTILANYMFQSGIGQLRLSNLVLHASEMGRQAIERLMGGWPNQFTFPISQWCMDEGIVLGRGILSGNLTRVNNFDFSPEKSFTTVTVLVEYPNASQSGRYVLTEVRFLDISKPPLTIIGTLQGSSVRKTAEVLNEPGRNISTRIMVTSYLFDNINNLNTNLGLVADQPALLMAGSRIAESTDNPWRPPNIFNLSIGSGNQQFTVRFPNRMNIRINHANFTNNNPVVSWDPFPGANGYFVFVIKRNRNRTPGNSDPFIPLFYHHTMGTSATINALTINPGDLIIIQVYALDGTSVLNPETRRGAIFMDSLSISR